MGIRDAQGANSSPQAACRTMSGGLQCSWRWVWPWAPSGAQRPPGHLLAWCAGGARTGRQLPSSCVGERARAVHTGAPETLLEFCTVSTTAVCGLVGLPYIWGGKYFFLMHCLRFMHLISLAFKEFCLPLGAPLVVFISSVIARLAVYPRRTTLSL